MSTIGGIVYERGVTRKLKILLVNIKDFSIIRVVTPLVEIAIFKKKNI